MRGDDRVVSLQDVIAGAMRATVVDDGELAERERGMRELEVRTARRDRLQTEGVPLDAATQRAIIAGGAALVATTSLEVVRRWLTSSTGKPILVLSGGTGCGKSVAAAYAIANSPSGGRWRLASAVCRAFSAQYGPLVDDQVTMRRNSMLVVDDVGTELTPDVMTSALIELIDYRRTKRTLITTNLDKRTFSARYGDERLISRMRAYASWSNDATSDMRGRASK